MTTRAYDPNLQKDPRIHDVLIRLRDRLGGKAFEVIDHWDADLCAVGIGRPSDNRFVAYVSTWGLPNGRYYLSLDAPSATDRDSETEEVERYEDVDFPTLVRHVARHMDCTHLNGSDDAV